MRSTLNSVGLVAAIAGVLAIVFIAATSYRDMGSGQVDASLPAPTGTNTGAVMTEQSGGTAVVETLPRVDPDEAASTTDTPTGDENEDASSETGTEVAASDPDSPAAVDAPDIPDLDLVRVEPTGDAVFAGRVEPGWTVELRNGEDVVATTEANEGGEWVIALDDPLPAGATELSLHATSPDGSMAVHAPDNVTVVVDAARTETPLVVVSDPDSPTSVLQTPESTAEILDTPDTSPEPEVAAVTDGDNAQAEDVARVPEPGVTEGPVEAADASDTPVSSPTGETGTDIADTGEAGRTEEADVAAPVDDGSVTGTEATSIAAIDPGATADDPPLPEPAPDQPTETQTAEPTARPVEPAATDGNSETPTIAVPQVAIETVETTDEGTLFVTGRAEPGEQVRAYGNNEELGIGTADESGRWTVRSARDTGAERVLTIRADAIDTTNGAPTSRVEVSFSRPAPGETVVALMPVPTTRAEAEDDSFDRLIVRKGDNLWTIARQIYGEGVRFTTIYQANANQIGNPDLIYPGQVFAIPKGLLQN